MSSVIVIKRNNLRVWGDVIFALFLREVRVGFNDKLGISWALIEPIVFIFFLSYFRSTVAGSGSNTHTLPTFLFMAVGVLYVQSFLKVVQGASLSIKKNKALFAFRQVQPISAVIAASLFELIVKVFTVIGVSILMFYMAIELRVDNPILFIMCFFSLVIFGTTVGLLFGIAELFIPEVEKIRTLLTRPLFFISGIFFSLQDIPKEYWYLLDWNPILHAIELSRYSLYESYGSHGVNLNYLLFITFTMLFFSIATYFVSWKQAISR
ncbi:ABC transporter permease [Glaciecola sp. 1036]|uniref:ABC transporter permease n=1 Tax=Alteromonadaceae TaxID=72275 RepID=UPI003D061A04